MEKFCLITGASGGIGEEFAKIFARQGHNLILTARSEEKLAKLKYKLEKKYSVKVCIYKADLTSEDEIQQLYDYASELGQVDVLINNAGFGNLGAFLDTDYERQKALLNLNITALVRLSYLFGNDMKKSKNGQIINVASAAAFAAGPYMAAYYASKSFVLSFSQALSEELKSAGITVTALCPGPTETGFEKNANMGNSVMFSIVRPESARRVAKAGYNALMNQKSVKYHGIVTCTFNIVSRLFPRKTAARFAKIVNRRR